MSHGCIIASSYIAQCVRLLKTTYVTSSDQKRNEQDTPDAYFAERVFLVVCIYELRCSLSSVLVTPLSRTLARTIGFTCIYLYIYNSRFAFYRIYILLCRSSKLSRLSVYNNTRESRAISYIDFMLQQCRGSGDSHSFLSCGSP